MTPWLLLVLGLECSSPAAAIRYRAARGDGGNASSAAPASQNATEQLTELKVQRANLTDLLGKLKDQVVELNAEHASTTARQNEQIDEIKARIETSVEQLKNTSLDALRRQVLENRTSSDQRTLEYWEGSMKASQKMFRSRLNVIHGMMLKTQGIIDAYDQILETGAMDAATAKKLGLDPENIKDFSEAAAANNAGGAPSEDDKGEDAAEVAPVEAVAEKTGGSDTSQETDRSAALVEGKKALEGLMDRVKKDVVDFNRQYAEESARNKLMVAKFSSRVQDDEERLQALTNRTESDKRTLEYWTKSTSLHKDSYHSQLGVTHSMMGKVKKVMQAYDSVLTTGTLDPALAHSLKVNSGDKKEIA